MTDNGGKEIASLRNLMTALVKDSSGQDSILKQKSLSGRKILAVS